MSILSGKVAIVTGASSGIGKETVLVLASAGAKVIAIARRIELAEETASQARAKGVEALAYRADVTDFPKVNQVFEDVFNKFGRIDILINNAGLARDNLILRMTEDEWDQVLDTNLKGIFFTTKIVARYMIKQRAGKIVNVSSVSGITGNRGQCNYAASKAGIIGLTKSAAKELAPRGITVNAVAPGFITTEMTDTLNEYIKDAALKAIPLSRFGSPSDVAKGILFLASPDADYITGHVLQIDGGLAM
ncbi:MAG TPA: 3-oxoacyl-[acyl-carrier-protein] reductase [Candidatus Brocadiales bacterium]|nr:3-oxoacyl-[acyl-carrier-protein] reductase [Candidatus Brocadiales bacterium]